MSTLMKKKIKFSSYTVQYKEIQSGKSYMGKGLLIYGEMRKYFPMYEEAVSHTYDFATAPLWISLYMRKICFSFLSVYGSIFAEWDIIGTQLYRQRQ
jgi:hypothetical protein